MKHNSKVILMALSVLITLTGMAQENRPIKLNEAIELSIKNSKQLKVNSARIDQATAALKEATDRKLPDVSASASYLRLSSANINIKRNDTAGGGNGGGSPSVSQAMYGILNASLPIYTGGRIKYGIESSRFLAQAARLDADNEKEDVIENTVEAYVNLYKAKSAVNLVRENLAQNDQRLKDLRNLEKNGLLARNDLLKAELQRSNTELALLEAENNWQLANVNMNLMLGLPEQTQLAPDSAIVQQSYQVKTLDEYVQSALSNRKDLASLESRKQAATSGVKATRGEYYPSLALTGGYVAAHIPKVLTITNAMNIGVGVSYNLGSLWKTKAKVEGAEARVREVAANEELLNDNIRLQVNRSYLNWLNSQKKIEVYAKAIEQATENQRIVNNKYANSLATTTDVLEADVAQLQAQMNYSFAKADAVVAYHQLLQAAGQINTINQ
ncbi:MAG TPA: TolC family protein [Flavisolibacter sp.]|jgi:outer membrane protein TolC|nr:TolC family protein [Flavisolibacter sp.]